MKAIFFGTSSFAVPSLQALAQQHTVVLCITQPDQPKGRGLQIEASPVKQEALRLGIALQQSARLTAADIASVSADVGVVASYGQLIRREVMDKLPCGILGVHPSLLPKYRGAAPVAWALMQGEVAAGVTIFRINEALDAGDILLKEETPIRPQENAGQLTDRLARLAAEVLVRAMASLDSKQAVFTPQDAAKASFAPKLTKSQGRIDWHKPADEIDCLIRAVVPWPGAVTSWQGKPLKVWAARVADDKPAPATAGRITAVREAGIRVATGHGIIELLQLQLSGKRCMSVKEFLAGHKIEAGELLGKQ